MKTIAITGASGFVGTSLTKYFSDLGYKIIPISRDILNNNKKLEMILDLHSHFTKRGFFVFGNNINSKNIFKVLDFPYYLASCAEISCCSRSPVFWMLLSINNTLVLFEVPTDFSVSRYCVKDNVASISAAFWWVAPCIISIEDFRPSAIAWRSSAIPSP